LQADPHSNDDSESTSGSTQALAAGINPTLKLTVAEIAITLALVGQNRVLASLIGPAGFGVYGLLQSLFRFVSSFSASWMSAPVTKWIAEYGSTNNRESQNRLYSLSLTTALAILIPACLVFAVFHRPIIDGILGGEVKIHHYFIFIVFSALTAVRTVQSAILQGLLLIGRITLIKTVSAGIQVVLVLTLVSKFGLTGMFYGLTISLSIGVLMAFTVIHRNAKLGITKPVLRSDEAKNLAQFGGANLILLVVALTTEYTQRLIVLDSLGIESVGLMVAAMQIIVYMDIFNRSAVFYWFAKMSKTSSPQELMDDYSGFSRLVLITGIPIVVGGILFGGTAIDLLLGSKFSTLTSSLYLFLIWQFLNLVHNPPAMAIMALTKIKVHAIASLTSGLTVPIVMYLGLNYWDWGFESIGIALIIGGVLAYLPRVLYMGIMLKIWATTYTWALTGVGVLMMVVAILLRDQSLMTRGVVLVSMTALLYAITPKVERTVIINGVTQPISRIWRK
jgi:enterobacterial common antigen flippase